MDYAMELGRDLFVDCGTDRIEDSSIGYPIYGNEEEEDES